MNKWQKIEEAIDALTDLLPAERDQWLADYCGDDEELRYEIASLLAYESEAAGFLERSLAPYTAVILPDGEDGNAGKKFGNYNIVREIGRGGMGAVFLAERADGEFEQKTAIKIVRQTIAEKVLIERFRRERQILASLNHPNIATLIDGGVSESGEPYLVMEYIEGDGLLDYASRKNLDIKSRLILFMKVCQAVAFAHRNLIIHRDIKPSNILVDNKGEPKLLDFGLAKAFDEALSDEDQTQTALKALTPAYASPGQLRGENVTTASDIYSLGVVLYELLTGSRPYKLKTNSLEEMLRAVSTSEPTKPSAVPETGGQSEIRHLQLKGDLDNIILMALSKEPERRYTSVEEFAADIQRYLDKKPVAARQATLGYRVAKFVKRHTAGVAAGGLIVAAIIAGTTISIWQARRATLQRERAERRFNDIRKLSRSLMFEIHDSVKDLPGSTPTRQLIVARALEYLNSLAQEAGDDASLLQELATAYGKVGDIQGNPFGANLGDIEGAMNSYSQAIAMSEKLLAADPGNSDLQRNLAGLLDRAGEIKIHSSDIQAARDDFKKALAIRENLLSASPEDASLQREIAVSGLKIGEVSQKLGDQNATLEYIRRALASFESLSLKDPNNPKAKRDVVIAYNKLGYVQFNAGDLASALETYRKGFKFAEELAAQNPDNAVAQRDLSLLHNSLGRTLLKQNDTSGAEDNFRKSLDISQKLAAADPKNELARSDVSYVLVRLGAAQIAAGKFAEALSSERKALEINEALYAANPKHAFALSEIADSYIHIGDILEKTNDRLGALDSYRHAAETCKKMSDADPSDAQYRRTLADSYQTLGRVTAILAEESRDPSKKLSFWKDSRSWSEQSLEIWHELQSRGVLNANDSVRIEETQAQFDRSTAVLAAAKCDNSFLNFHPEVAQKVAQNFAKWAT